MDPGTDAGDTLSTFREPPRMNPIAVARTCVITAALLLMAAGAHPHEVVVEQIVQIDLQPQGDRLVARIRIPATALVDATLPRLADGTLDEAAMRAVLPLVAADVVRTLDMQQGGTTLLSPDATSRLSADRRSIEVDVTYRIDGAEGLSARLNAFRGEPLRPVRTTVRYAPAAGAAQTVSLIGPPTRVSFDPGVVDTSQEFLARALTAVLAFGDHLLLLACLLAPARSTRDAARLLATVIGAQAAGLLAFALGSNALAGALPVAAMIASSVIVMAAVQNVVRARLALVAALATAFGILNGLAFGRVFATDLQFAGSHRLGAFAVFLATIAVAELWLGAIVVATRARLDGRGVPDRITTLVVSAVIAHTAVHHVIDRSHEVGQSGWFTAEHAILSLTLGWAAVMVLVAASEAVRRRRAVDRTGPIVSDAGL